MVPGKNDSARPADSNDDDTASSGWDPYIVSITSGAPKKPAPSPEGPQRTTASTANRRRAMLIQDNNDE